MSKAKKKAAGGGKEGGDAVDYVEAFCSNYARVCKYVQRPPVASCVCACGRYDARHVLRSLGISQLSRVVELITAESEDGSGEPKQLIVEGEDVGSAAARAICAAVLGNPEEKRPGYAPLKSLRFWRCSCGDGGVSAASEVLRLGRDEVVLTLLEFMDCRVGPPGCLALGESLMLGANKSLLTLRLDYNDAVGDEGVANLCKGLRTNAVLQKLHLGYCNIGPAGAGALGRLLSVETCAITSLDLTGNHVGSEGVAAIAGALEANKRLSTLTLFDNQVGAHADASINTAAMRALAGAMRSTESALSSIDLTYNCIDAGDADAYLRPALTDSAKIVTFLVDETLPAALFELLMRAGGGGGGKKGKKKKK